MTVAELISLLRTQTYTTSGELTDAQLLSFLNITYHDIENSIIRYVRDDYFWDRYTSDLVEGQTEYSLQAVTWATVGMKKIRRVELKYGADDTYRTVVGFDTLDSYKQSEDYLENNVSKSSPIYRIADNSIFIYPKPGQNVAGGLVLHTINSNMDLTTAGTETDIFTGHQELRDFHHTIVTGAKQYVFGARGQIDLKNDAKNEYEIEKRAMISILNGRMYGTMEGQLSPERQFYK